MPSYGYMIHQFEVHRIGKPDEPLRLGTLHPPEEPSDQGSDVLRLLYGILHGLVGHRIEDSSKTKHLELTGVEPVGRCVKFSMDMGRSGQESRITDPGSGTAFRRTPRHIENVPRRGLLVAPDHSTAGLLVLEAYGRATGRQLLSDELRRSLRANTDPARILNYRPAVDGAALAAYLEQAQINAIRLRKFKLPQDKADQLEMEGEEVDAGELDTFVRGPIKRRVLQKLQDNAEARRRMLLVDTTEYDEATVQVQVGGRSLTVDVTNDRAPRFITVLGKQRPSDLKFYEEVTRAIPDMAPGVNVRLADQWATKPWPDDRRAFIIGRPHVEGSADESASSGK